MSGRLFSLDAIGQACADVGISDSRCESLSIALAEPPAKTFEQAWQAFKDAGYQYGRDALEQVRFGWEIAHGKLPR